MKTNVGRIDQAIRILAGLLLLGLFAAGLIGAWGLIGVVLLATGLVRFCPLYRRLGLHTGRHPTRLP